MPRTRLYGLVCLTTTLVWRSTSFADQVPIPPPPSEWDTRNRIKEHRDDLTIQCARKHHAPKTITLRVRGHESGRAEVTSTSNEPFSQCFVKLTNNLENGGGTYQEAPKPYRFEVTLKITNPETIIRNGFDWFERHSFSGRAVGRRYPCIPRPGAIPTEANFHVTLNDKGVAVRVKTTPNNPRVDACLRTLVDKSMAYYGAGTWNVQIQQRIPVDPMLTSKSLNWFISNYGPGYARFCSPSKRPPKHVRVSLTARVDAKQFAIKVTAKGDNTFKRCLIATFQEKLRGKYALTLYIHNDGTVKHDYFRITSNAHASVTFPVESMEEVAKRKRLKRKRREERCSKQRQRGRRSSCDRRYRPD